MSQAFIRIKAGAYRTTDVSGKVFALVEQYKTSGRGGFVTVKNGNNFPGFPEDIRIKVDSMTAYEFVPDEEARDRLSGIAGLHALVQLRLHGAEQRGLAAPRAPTPP